MNHEPQRPSPSGALGPGLWALLTLLGVLALWAHATHPDGHFTRGGQPHGDGLYHFAQVRSLVLDRDLRLADDYAALGNPHGQPVRAQGWAGNHFTVGTAVVWIPSFVVAQGVVSAGGAMGLWNDTGGALRVQRWTMFGSVVAGWLALVLTARTLRRWFLPRTVGVVIVLAALATPLWWYMTRQPSWSHAASAFAVAGLVHASVRGDVRRGWRAGVSPGLWLGLVALVRPQDAVFVVVPLSLVGIAWRRGAALPDVGRVLAVMFGVALVVWLPQAWVWQQTYGQPWLVPQGPQFMRWSESQWSWVLWSSRGGLLAWSPAVAVALGGLLVGAVRRGPVRGLSRALVVAVILEVFVCGAVADWWGGWAFGARRLVGCTVAFGVGWAVVLEPLVRGAKWKRGVVLLFSLAAVRLSMQMQADYLEARLQRGVPQSLAPAWSRAFGMPLDSGFETVGTPGSWPANWVFAARTGAEPGAYDEAVGWALVRSRGDDKGYERLWIHDSRWALSGLGAPHRRGGHQARVIEERAVVGLPLRQGLVLDGRLRLWAGEVSELRVEGWGDGSTLALRPGWHDYPLPTGTEFEAGYGVIELVVTDGGPVEVAWLDVFVLGRDPMERPHGAQPPKGSSAS